MLTSRVTHALRQCIWVIALAILLAMLDLREISDMRRGVFPAFAPPLVEVQADPSGLLFDGQTSVSASFARN